VHQLSDVGSLFFQCGSLDAMPLDAKLAQKREKGYMLSPVTLLSYY
jgi:hypothetical protein